MRRPRVALAVSTLLAASSLLAGGVGGAPAVGWPDLSRPPERQGGGEKDAAVIVGISDYDELPDVPGAAQNASDWKQYLLGGRRLRPSRVTTLLDGSAKLPLIRQAIEKAVRQAEPGGTLWFVFIGHGAPARDGREGMVVTYDAGRDPTVLYDRSLGQSDLTAALAKGRQARTIVVLDACFSGQGTVTGETLAAGLQPLIPTTLPAPEVGNLVLLTAGTGSQFAGPLRGAERPAFSYLLLGALRGWADRSEYVGDRNGEGTLGEAVGYVREALAATVIGREQEPQALGGSGADVLATGAREPGPDLIAAGTAPPESTSPVAGPWDDREGGGRASARPATATVEGHANNGTRRHRVGADRGRDGRDGRDVGFRWGEARAHRARGDLRVGEDRGDFGAVQGVRRGRRLHEAGHQLEVQLGRVGTTRPPDQLRELAGRQGVRSLGRRAAAERSRVGVRRPRRGSRLDLPVG